MASITAHRRRPGRYLVELGDGGSVVASIDIIARLKLVVGRVVDAADRSALAAEAVELSAYDRALALLAASPRSARDLHRRLVRKGELAAAADAAIARLCAQGLLDDAAFAREFARSKVRSRAMSRRRIQAELGRRGVSRGEVDAAVAEVFADEAIDEQGAAVTLAEKKAAALRNVEPSVRKRRVTAFLLRRGFDHAVVREVVKRVMTTDAPDGSTDGE